MILRVLNTNVSAVMCLKCRLVKVSTVSQKMFRFGRQVHDVESTRSLPVLLWKRSLFTGTGKLARTKMPYETDTNVAKDTLMYINDSSKYYKILSFFGVAQLAFWVYLAFFCHNNLKDAPAKVSEKKKTSEEASVSWWQKLNLGENKYRNGLTTICLIGGYLMFLISWTYPKRAIRQLWLLKGGETIGIVTYGHFGRSMNTVVPLNNISCVIARERAVTQIPIKVKGKWLFHLLDMKGLFKEPKLFDCTVGLKRTLS